MALRHESIYCILHPPLVIGTATDNVVTFITTAEAVTAVLFTVSLTLLALVPPLAEMSRQRGASYFATANAKDALRLALGYLAVSLALFGASLIGGGVGLIWPSVGLAIGVAATDLAGLVIVVLAGARLARLAMDAI